MKKLPKVKTRKAQIILAAAKVFAENGYDYATVEEIANKAGFSDSTIYKYFANKQVLLGQVIAKFARQVEDMVLEHLQLIRGAGHQIRGILGSYAKAFEQDPIFGRACRVCIHQYQMLERENSAEPLDKLRRLVESTIKQGMASGEFNNNIDVATTAAVLIGAVNQTVLLWLYTPKRYDLIEAVDDILDIVFLGVVQPSGYTDAYCDNNQILAAYQANSH